MNYEDSKIAKKQRNIVDIYGRHKQNHITKLKSIGIKCLVVWTNDQ